MNRYITRPGLAELALFAQLSSETVARIERSATTYHVQTNEMLYSQGDVAHSFYVVREGGVRLVEHTAEGQTVQLKVYGAGEIFGLLAISGAFVHPSGAQAVEDSVIVGMKGDDARTVMMECPEFALMVVDLLVSHVHHSHDRIRQLAAERVERRLARALLHYAVRFGDASTGVLAIDVALTQRDLGEFVGATPETVNRILRQWEGRGVVRRSRQRVEIHDHDALVKLSADVAYMGIRL